MTNINALRKLASFLVSFFSLAVITLGLTVLHIEALDWMQITFAFVFPSLTLIIGVNALINPIND